MAVKCSGGITCQYCFYSLLNSVLLLFLLLCGAQRSKLMCLQPALRVCKYVCVDVSARRVIILYIYMYMCVSEQYPQGENGKHVVLNFKKKENKKENHTQRVMDFICLKPRCRDQ